MGNRRAGASPDLLFDICKILVPTDYLANFDVVSVNEHPSEWRITLHEKECLVPACLRDCTNVVLDGFCNPVHILGHAFSLKPVMLVIHRRRWKEGSTEIHFDNWYTFTKTSAKITPQMADFLKI